MGGFGTFALGVGAALAVQAFGPALGRWLRPAARAAVKQGIILSEGAQVRAAGLREDLEDLVAEAREDARRDAQGEAQRGPRDGAQDGAQGGTQAAPRAPAA